MMNADVILPIAGSAVLALTSAAFTAAVVLARVQAEIASIRTDLARVARQIDDLQELYRDHDRAIARAQTATF